MFAVTQLETGMRGTVVRKDHDPAKKTEAGVVAGQLVAATLSSGFDAADPNFSESENHLADQVLCDTSLSCDGLSVGELVAEANLVIGGCEPETDRDAAELSDCLAIVNEN